MTSRNFCTTAELAAELGDPDLGLIDASWHLPNSGRIGVAEFRAKHIPGAVFFDIDTIADHDQGLPHMLPKPEALAKAMTALGLGDRMRFVVYDATGLYAAARVWWTLRAYRVERGAHPRWWPAQMDQGRPAAGNRRRPSQAPPIHGPAGGRLRRLARGGAIGARDRFGPSGGRAGGGAIPRRNRGAAARRQKRPHPRQPQPAVCRHHRAWLAESRRTGSRPPSRSMGSTSRSPSSPPADRGSPPPSWRWRSRRPAARSQACTTAHGPNGARAPTARWRLGRSEGGLRP